MVCAPAATVKLYVVELVLLQPRLQAKPVIATLSPAAMGWMLWPGTAEVPTLMVVVNDPLAAVPVRTCASPNASFAATVEAPRRYRAVPSRIF